jgi:predicted DCC family thiol-disulfide oxidoreductase YuxK
LKPVLILAYDAECSVCCRMMDRLRARDRHGRLVFFPLQSRELVAIAPELAGRDLHGEIHGLEEGTRRVWQGADLLPHVLARLPGWKLLAPLLRLHGLRHAIAATYRWRAARRFRKYGRQPFQDRF